MKKSVLVRCGNEYKKTKCDNPIYVRKGNAIVVKRHGRISELILVAGQHMFVTCERCGKRTRIDFEEE